MQFNIITLFPEMFEALAYGITGRALRDKQISLRCFNPRNYTKDKHQSVDDHPYGGGPGMLMMVDPLKAAIQDAKARATGKPTTLFLSPQGKLFQQDDARRLTAQKSIILIAGRYEGVDQRLIEQEVDEEWSIGDYILTGGELPAMVIMDAITRLLPGVVGTEASIEQDSITTGLLKYPQYTRPEHLDDASVPEVLLSGHHKHIARWRRKQALGKTWLRRPDLLAKTPLNADDEALLTEFRNEYSQK